MATYAIGDIQGCARTLDKLLQRIAFDRKHDHLVLVGDLVNRGSDSLATLRWAHAHDDCITMVLGNHDLALLAQAHGVRKRRDLDTLDEVLAAPDADTLLAWLAARPFAVRTHGHLVLHAGVLPSWDEADVLAGGHLAQAALQGPQARGWLQALLDPQIASSADVARWPGLEAGRVLTYLRVLDAQGQPQNSFRGGLADVAPGCMPWFVAPTRRTRQVPILCGHWAALGVYRQHGITALDSGCVWGGPLTALRLDDGSIIAEPCAEISPRTPGSSE